MRLDKYLAEAGVGRRKDVREYIKQGLVMVNGEISIQPTLEIKEGIDIILYDKIKLFLIILMMRQVGFFM